jgi:hypothetical protein
LEYPRHDEMHRQSRTSEHLCGQFRCSRFSTHPGTLRRSKSAPPSTDGRPDPLSTGALRNGLSGRRRSSG